MGTLNSVPYLIGDVEMKPIRHYYFYRGRKVLHILKHVLVLIIPIAVLVILFLFAYLPVTTSDIVILGSDMSADKSKIVTRGNEIPSNVGTDLYDKFGNLLRRPLTSKPVKEVNVNVYDDDIDLMCNTYVSETQMNDIISKLITHKGIVNCEDSIYYNSGHAFILASQKTKLDPIFLLVLSETVYYNFNTTVSDIDKIDINTPYTYTANQKFCVLVEQLSDDFFYNYYLPDIARTLFDVGLIADYTAKVPSIRYLMDLDMQYCYDVLNGGQ